MLTLETVRAAILSAKPWPALDQLIRTELAAGRTTKQLYESLSSMTDAIDSTPGLSEAGSDALGDALDALTGFCHRDCQYQDEPMRTSATESIASPRIEPADARPPQQV